MNAGWSGPSHRTSKIWENNGKAVSIRKAENVKIFVRDFIVAGIWLFHKQDARGINMLQT